MIFDSEGKSEENIAVLYSQYSSVFLPGFRRTLGFREWLPGVRPKQTEIAWDEIRNHSSTRL